MLVVTIVILVTVTYLYVFRDQEIRLEFIPPELEFCGKKISKGAQEYDELLKVLTAHKGGWNASFTSFVPTQVYFSPAFKVNIVGKQVVVSYKIDEGYPQFIKLIKYNWSSSCAK